MTVSLPEPTPVPTSAPEPEASPDTSEDGGSVASDEAALLALKSATAGPGWVFLSTSWLSDRPLDEWLGVTTNSDGRVIELTLFLGLTGPIPAELNYLTKLERLDLSDNNLTGPIPAELNYLINLEELDLRGNQLTGCVPAGLRGVPSNALGDLNLPDCGTATPGATATPTPRGLVVEVNSLNVVACDLMVRCTNIQLQARSMRTETWKGGQFRVSYPDPTLPDVTDALFDVRGNR